MWPILNMATSIGSGMLLARASNFLSNSLIRESKLMPRCLTQLEVRRGRRRTTRRAGWHVDKKVQSFWTKRELTRENQAFLSEVIEDRYKDSTQSPLKEEPFPRNQWTPQTKRTGVLAIKIGVIPQWTRDGKKFFTTMLQVIDNHVINYVPPEEYCEAKGFKREWRGLGSVVVGALSVEPFQYTKAYNHLFLKAGTPPKRKLTRFLVTPDAAVQPGTPLTALHFQVGDYVDVQAKTIGHGFQGVVKRHGFKGGPASHGATKFQRRPGSIGGGGDKAAVWKGKKMPGHMGMDWRTLRGLRIWRMNTKYNVLYVTGPCLPGPNHCYVRLMDTSLVNRRDEMMERPPLMPTYFPGDLEDIQEEIFDEELYQFTEETIKFEEKS